MPSGFRAAAILGHTSPRLRGDVKVVRGQVRLPCPRARRGKVGGRLDTDATGGVFPCRSEADVPTHQILIRIRHRQGLIPVLKGN